MRAAVAAIREISLDRIIIVDGLSWAREPVPELADLGIAQSCRAYEPMFISHYKASWVDAGSYPEPAWPGHGWDRKRLEEQYQKWADLAKKGVGVHCGEGGAYNKTPHKVVLAWLRDVLEILTGRGTQKTPVLGLVERNGRVRTRVLPDVTGKTLKTAIKENVDMSSTRLITDEMHAYKKIGKKFRGGHEVVNHSRKEYARGDVTTNTVESFFALIKRGIYGTFHVVSKNTYIVI